MLLVREREIGGKVNTLHQGVSARLRESERVCEMKNVCVRAHNGKQG